MRAESIRSRRCEKTTETDFYSISLQLLIRASASTVWMVKAVLDVCPKQSARLLERRVSRGSAVILVAAVKRGT